MSPKKPINELDTTRGIISVTGNSANVAKFMKFYENCIEKLDLCVYTYTYLIKDKYKDEDKNKDIEQDEDKDKEAIYWNIKKEFGGDLGINISKYKAKRNIISVYLSPNKCNEIGIVNDEKSVKVGEDFIRNFENNGLPQEIAYIVIHEREKSIQFETEFVSNAKIFISDNKENDFKCKIKGKRKEINKAIEILEKLLRERISKIKIKCISFKMYDFCTKHSLFLINSETNEIKCDETKNHIIDMRNIKIQESNKRTSYFYTNTKIIEIVGSSKSVHKFLNSLKRLMKIKCSEEDQDLFSDRISWSRHHLKCLKIVDKQINLDEYKHIDHARFLEEAENVENKIKHIKNIHYPDEWNIEDISKICLQELKETSVEYKKVQIELNKGFCQKDKITKIERVVNPFQWNLYNCKLREIKYKHFKNCDYSVPKLETLVWHGTSGTNPIYICISDEGVDKRYIKYDMSKNSVNTSAIKYYGKGCYFATASGYSDNQYSYFLKGTKEDESISTVNQMLLCNVIIGAYDYGSVALTNSQCLTNTKRQTDEIVNNLIEFQNPNRKNEGRSKWESSDNDIYYPERANKIKKYEENVEKAVKDIDQDARFDSIMDDRFMIKKKEDKCPKPRMYVTFDNAQSYPAYLITYERFKANKSKMES